MREGGEYRDSLFTVLSTGLSISLYQLTLIQQGIDNDSDVAQTLSDAGFPKEVEQQAVIELLQRWTEYQTSKPKTNPRKGKPNSLGFDLSESLASLNNTEICLCLANYNPTTALVIYKNQDFRVTLEAYSLYCSQKVLAISTNFDAAVLAAGGELKKSNTATTHSSDIEKGSVISFG